ncbi:hypothetical protein ACP70R_037860 [Stipagrostis hirtigluma subsp. patula]
MAAVPTDPNHHSIPVRPGNQPGAASGKPAAPPWETAQRRLNRFVRTIALMERMGNALGALAFTWATVVVLGGFSADLGRDFWYATAIVFIEAFRVFSRQSRSDDKLLFKTTKSIRLKGGQLMHDISYYLTVGVVIACLYAILVSVPLRYGYLDPPEQLEFIVLVLVPLLALLSLVRPTIVQYMKDHVALHFSPLVVVLGLGGVMLWFGVRLKRVALVIAPLLVGCLRYAVIGVHKLKVLASLPVWLRRLGSLSYTVWIVLSVLFAFRAYGITILLGTLLLGNIQFPVALARVALSLMRLFGNDDHHDKSNGYLAPTLKIFYAMVLGQGVLYILACILESVVYSCLRRSLTRTLSALRYKKEFKFVDMYYEYAYDKCMEDGVFAEADLNLVRFAVDSLNSNSYAKKLAAVQILDSLLRQVTSKTRLVSELTRCNTVVTTLINMLGWRATKDEDIKIMLFASKVIAMLAGDIQIVGIPGTMQKVTSLLDMENQLVIPDVSTHTTVSNEGNIDNQHLDHGSTATVDIAGEEAGDQPVTIQNFSMQGNNERSTYLCKFLKRIKNLLSAPKEDNELMKDEDSLPVLGMLILERLCLDLDNCAEICRATGLIPKIIGFISYTTDTTKISEAQLKLRTTSSLKVVAKLISTKGEIGMALWRKISEQPILLSNLAEILEDSRSGVDQWEPTIVIIAKLAIDKESSQEIGSFQVFIPKLMHAFLGQDESSDTYYDYSLRMVAGEALSNLSMENASNCLAILGETRYKLIENLKNILQNDEYTYVASSLLQNICAHSGERLCHQESSEHLSSTLSLVLEKIMDAEGKQLEALTGLVSQICCVIPGHFVQELESHTNGAGLVQKLVGTLHAYKKPSPEYPRMRRVIVHMTISIMESCPRYAVIFREQGMMEALSKVERTPSKVEKYRAFFGNTGVVLESGLPLPVLVARAKGLIGTTTPNPGAQRDNPP